MNLMQEYNVIISGLYYFWDCRLCKKLGWQQEHNCPENNSDCGIFVYNKLKAHFENIYKSKWKAEAEKK